MKNPFVPIAVLLALGSTQVLSQGFDPMDPANADIIREKHINSVTLPDSIAFMANARIFRSIVDEEGMEYAALGLADESGMSYEDARNAVSLSIGALNFIDKDIESANRAIACTSDNVQKYYGDAAADALSDMDDQREVIGESHLTKVKSALSAKGASQYQAWLDTQKVNVKYVKFDHKKALAKNGGNADTGLATICAQPGDRK